MSRFVKTSGGAPKTHGTHRASTMDQVKAWATLIVFLAVLSGICLGGMGVFTNQAVATEPAQVDHQSKVKLPVPPHTVPAE